MILRPRFVQKPFLNFWFRLIAEYIDNIKLQLEDYQIEFVNNLIKMDIHSNYKIEKGE